MSNEKTQQCKGLFTSLLTKFQDARVPCLSQANFNVLKMLNNIPPTAILSCKALVSQLIEYKKSAFIPDDKKNIHEFIVKILFTFAAFQDNAEQKALLQILTPLFPKGQDEGWDNLLVNLQKMITAELPSSQNVQVVSTLATGYQTFIQTLLQFKAQAALLPFNETLIVSLLIAGAEKAQTYAKSGQKGALSFTDEDEIKAFIQQKFDPASSVVLLELYTFSLLKSRLVEKLKTLKEGLEVNANASLKILEQVDAVENYQEFFTLFTSLQKQVDTLSKAYEAIQTEANDCLKNPELLKNADLISSIEKKLAAIVKQYETLAESIKTQQDILDQRIQTLSTENQKAYQELTENLGQFNRESNEFLSQVIAIRLAFNRAKEAKLIPLTQKNIPLYAEKMTSIAQKFAVIEEHLAEIKSFQTQQSQLVASKTSVAKFAKHKLVEQYQTYAEFEKAFEVLKQTFNETPLVLSNPTAELKEIKASFENRIEISEKKLKEDQSQLKKLVGEEGALGEEKASLEKGIVQIFVDKLGETIFESEAFDCLGRKIITIFETQKRLSENQPILMKKLEVSFQALSNDIQADSLKECDENFHPILKALAEIIVWLFWRENLPADSWLLGLKVFSDNQKKLEEKLDFEQAKLEGYLDLDFTKVSYQAKKKEISEEIPRILEQHTVSRPENANHVLEAIRELLKNETEQEKNCSLLKWLEPFQTDVIELIKKSNENAHSREKITQIVKAEQSKLDALKKLDSQFFALTQAWQVLAYQLATGELKNLNDFLTAMDSVLPPSDMVMDLLQYAVEFGTQAHVICLVEKYPSHVNIPLSKKEKQPTILLLAYERMKSFDASDHERVHIFHDLLNRDNVDINVPNDEGNTLLHLAVAQNDAVTINDMFRIKTSFAVNQPNKQHYTALCQAVLAKNSEMMSLLLKSGATLGLGAPEKLDSLTMKELLSFRDDSENTLLHLAVLAENLPLVKQLFELRGTDDVAINFLTTPLIDRVNSDSETALHLAKKQGSQVIVEFLEGKGSGVKIDNRSAFTPVFQPPTKTSSNSCETVEKITVDLKLG